MNRSPLKDNSNVKENEYNNGYTERQTVGSNSSELPPIRVSAFENYYATEPLGCVDLMKWFKTAKFKEQVIAFRTTSNEKVRQRIQRNLPCITPSGIFKTRSRDGLVQHSGFVCIDIDHKDNGVFGPEWFEKKKLLAKTFDCLFYAGMSISGNGLCLIFRIAYPNKHPAQFDALVREIYEETGLVADQGCCDICRLRGASYDAYPYINPQAKPYRGVLMDRTARTKVRTAREKELLEKKVYKLIGKIRKEKKDITDAYHDWYSIGCALAHEYGKEGGAAVIPSGQYALQEVLSDRMRRAVRQMSAKPKNRDRDLPMDLQKTRGNIQVARRPACGAGPLSRGSSFFLLYLHPCVDNTRKHVWRNLHNKAPMGVVNCEIFFTFVLSRKRRILVKVFRFNRIGIWKMLSYAELIYCISV